MRGQVSWAAVAAALLAGGALVSAGLSLRHDDMLLMANAGVLAIVALVGATLALRDQ
jgi:hypothetical protein